VARIIAMQFPVTEIAMTMREAIVTQGGRCRSSRGADNHAVLAVIVSCAVFAVIVSHCVFAMCAHDVSWLRV
jgi:hypothetical protein